MNKLTSIFFILQNKINFNQVIVNEAAQKYFIQISFEFLIYRLSKKAKYS